MSGSRVVSVRVNGDRREFLCQDGQTALEAIRDALQLTGTKEGCHTGDCGACSVLLDGALVCSCLVLAAELEGCDLRTIEGIAEGAALHPVQRQLLEHSALQCGVCIPGIVVAARALLDANPDPSEAQVRFWLAGNLCRCTGYDKIVRAVLAAAAQLRAGEEGAA